MPKKKHKRRNPTSAYLDPLPKVKTAKQEAAAARKQVEKAKRLRHRTITAVVAGADKLQDCTEAQALLVADHAAAVAAHDEAIGLLAVADERARVVSVTPHTEIPVQ